MSDEAIALSLRAYHPEDLVDERTRRILKQRRSSRVVKDRGWLVRRMLLAADVVALVAASIAAEVLVLGLSHIDPGRLATFAATIPGWVVLAKLYGLYDSDQRRADHSTVDDIGAVFHLVTIGAVLFFGVTWAAGIATADAWVAGAFWLSAIVFVLTARGVGRALSRGSVKYIQNAVIVGAGDVGQAAAERILEHPEYGINVVGFVDGEPKERSSRLDHLTVLGAPEDLPALVPLLDVERVIVAFSNDEHESTVALIRELQPLGVHIDIVPRLFEVVGPGVGIHAVEGLALFGLPPARWSRSSLMLKRALDVMVAGAALLALAPVFAFLALLIKLDSRGPVFFRQMRVGAGDRVFRVYKFRTMVADADERKGEFAHLNKHAQQGGDARMFKIENDPRVTRVGRFLRRYFLDELPQLINVVKGEMSLVGPRPLILDEDRHVNSWRRRRLSLKPGMTGPWQVLGRSSISFEEMVRLDYLYVTNWSLANDLRLLCRTAPLVVRGDRPV